jgi:hypothetical protein
MKNQLLNEWIVQEAPHFGAWEWEVASGEWETEVYSYFITKFWKLGLETGALNLLDKTGRSLRCTNQLTYINEKEELETAWVEDAGELLRNFYPELVNTQKRNMELYPALKIFGGFLKKATIICFCAELHANIWFPYLPFSLWKNEEVADYQSINAKVDNTLLAWENSSRLNEWVRQINQLVKEVNGKTKFIRPQQHFYRPMINIDGIILE